MTFSPSSHCAFILLAYGAAFAILAGVLLYAEGRQRFLNRRYTQLKQKMQQSSPPSSASASRTPFDPTR